ncbi:MAG: hypothetical protein VX986_07645 [Pseudomonadota bacterium]|nr:hypothetical protein [Pseudomonadota bacterium]
MMHQVNVAEGMASQTEWVSMDEDGNFNIKVLSVDEGRKSVEVLFKIKGGYRSGAHKHTCETHVYVIKGKVKNHSIGCTFSAGDYCYQPLDDVHDEEFLEDTIVYASYRGDKNTLVEFLDDSGAVCGEFKLDDFRAAM